jgi:hypothetical protein
MAPDLVSKLPITRGVRRRPAPPAAHRRVTGIRRRAGPGEFLNAGPRHATEEAITSAIHEVAAAKTLKAINAGFGFETSLPGSFDQRFTRGVSRLGGFFG